VAFTVLFSTYYKSGEAPKAIGLINSFNSVGQMAAVFLGGIIAQSFGPRSTFLLGSIGAVVALALSTGIAEKKTVLREPVKTAELLTVAKDRYFLMICLLSIFSQFITFSTVYAFTPIAAKNLGADSFQLGLLTSLSILPGIFASVLSGSFFVKRYGERKTIIWGFIIIALSCIVIPWIKDINLLYATQFIGGFGRGIVFPVLMGLSIKNIHDSKRATAMGFFQATYSIGMFLGPVVTGVLNDMAGLDWGFRITGMIAITGAFIIARKPSRHESNGYI
jgi:MFS family permease